jgi:hypothetical protein
VALELQKQPLTKLNEICDKATTVIFQTHFYELAFHIVCSFVADTSIFLMKLIIIVGI